MATEVIGLEIQTNLGGLRSQLKEATAEVQRLSDKFGESSREANEAAMKAAKIKDAIGDANTKIAAFNPDRKFAAFSQSIQGVAGAFAGMQGAMGLIGIESQNVQKQLLKVQSALAFSEGLNTFLDTGVQGFKNLATVIKTSAVTAFNSLKAAIGATGIGLLVIGIGLLIMNFDKIKKAVMDFFPILNDTTKLFDRLKEIAMGVGNVLAQYVMTPFRALAALFKDGFGAAFQEVKKGLAITKNFQAGEEKQKLKNQAAHQEEALASLIKSKEKELEVLKASGKDTYKEELSLISLKKKLYKDDQVKLDELLQAERILRASHNKKLSDEIIKQNEKEKADKEKKKEEDAAIDKKKKEDRVVAINSAEKELENIKNDNHLKSIKNEEEREKEKIRIEFEKREIEINDLNINENLKTSLIIAETEKRQLLLDEIDNTKKDRLQKQKEEAIENDAKLKEKQLQDTIAFNDKIFAADKDLADKKTALVFAGLDLLSSVAGKNEGIANAIFAIQKAIEIGRIITSTIAAIQAVKTSVAMIPKILPPAFPNPAFLVAAAGGIKSIASLKLGAAASITGILATSIGKLKGGGGGSGMGGGGGIDTSAPLAPTATATGTTNISQSSINQLGSGAMRAYVVETDIRTGQERQRRIDRAARII